MIQDLTLARAKHEGTFFPSNQTVRDLKNDEKRADWKSELFLSFVQSVGRVSRWQINRAILSLSLNERLLFCHCCACLQSSSPHFFPPAKARVAMGWTKGEKSWGVTISIVSRKQRKKQSLVVQATISQISADTSVALKIEWVCVCAHAYNFLYNGGSLIEANGAVRLTIPWKAWPKRRLV